MKSRIIPVIFIIFLLSGYIIAGYARHHIYEGVIQDHVAQRIAFGEEGIEKPMGWEDFEYIGSPEAAVVVSDPVFQEEIYSLWDEWLVYSTEYNTDVLLSLLEEVDDSQWNVWSAYKKFTIFEYLRSVLTAAGNLGLRLAPYDDADRGGTLAESVASWEAAGGNREGDWVERYKQSPEYRTWLAHIFDEITDSRGIPSEPFDPRTMEDLYMETKQEVTLPFSSFLLQKDMLETQQKMTERAYNQYTVHLSEQDIPRTDIDAWVIRFGSSGFCETMTNCGFFNALRTGGFPRRDLVFDTCLIIGFALVSTFIVSRMVKAPP